MWLNSQIKNFSAEVNVHAVVETVPVGVPSGHPLGVERTIEPIPRMESNGSPVEGTK
jgi:hypothetical protein